MKKTVILLLALLLVLNLAACSGSYGDSQPTKSPSQPTTLPNEPTVDSTLQKRYQYAKERLQSLVENHLNNPHIFYVRPEGADQDLQGMEAMAWLYNEFKELGDYENSAKYAAGFSSIKNVPISCQNTLVDHMQNKNTVSHYTHYYDIDGRLIRFYGIPQELEYVYTTDPLTYYYEYDASGKISALKIKSGDNVSAQFTPTYDANGRIINYHYVNASGDERDYFYTYDDQGRLIESKIERVYENETFTDTQITRIRFIYNEAGLLTQKEGERLNHYDILDETFEEDRDSLSQRYIFTYTYDGTILTGMTETYQDIFEEAQYVDGKYVYAPYVNNSYTHQHTYTCDSQGRILEDTVVYGSQLDQDGNAIAKWDYVSCTTTYIYGDYWFYTPAK